jgi:hypothetical protein
VLADLRSVVARLDDREDPVDPRSVSAASRDASGVLLFLIGVLKIAGKGTAIPAQNTVIDRV